MSVYVSIRCFSTFYIFVVQSDLLKSWNLSCTGSSVVSTKLSPKLELTVHMDMDTVDTETGARCEVCILLVLIGGVILCVVTSRAGEKGLKLKMKVH